MVDYQDDKEQQQGSDYVGTLIQNADLNPNKWIFVDPGTPWVCLSSNLLPQLPNSHTMQRAGEHSCVFKSLINALNFIGDVYARDLLIKNIGLSLQVLWRVEFAVDLLHNSSGYHPFCLSSEADIIQIRSPWPTLHVLLGSD